MTLPAELMAHSELAARAAREGWYEPESKPVHETSAALLHRAADALEWRGIESAPRDGAWIQLAGGTIQYGWEAEHPPAVIGQWSNYLNGGLVDDHWQFAWYEGGYYGEYCNPTHWRPLDAPLPATPEGDNNSTNDEERV